MGGPLSIISPTGIIPIGKGGTTPCLTIGLGLKMVPLNNPFIFGAEATFLKNLEVVEEDEEELADDGLDPIPLKDEVDGEAVRIAGEALAALVDLIFVGIDKEEGDLLTILSDRILLLAL